MLDYSQRAVACFKALASGDAIGKQTETLSYADVQRWYPEGITGFQGVPGKVIPRYAGHRRYCWRIGETTDDAEQTIAVARALLGAEPISHTSVGRELLHCRKSLHPDVALWAFYQSGNPSRVASEDNGCGPRCGSRRLALAYSPERWDQLLCAAYECSIPTHGGPLALSAAAAVAAAISGAIEGRSASDVLHLAIQAAQQVEASLSTSNAGAPRMADRIEKTYFDLSGRDSLSIPDLAQHYFPDTNETKVPLAINLAVCTESAERTILIAANLGGDAGSVASIGGAMAGALRPDTVKEDWFQVVQAVNGGNLIEVAEALARLRQ